jgi:hypothetical protein
MTSVGVLDRNCSAAVAIAISSPLTLIWATPSTRTGTPEIEYTDGVLTSMVISSRERVSAFSKTGQTNVPPPFTMRKPTILPRPAASAIVRRRPETISTSFGPTFV